MSNTEDQPETGTEPSRDTPEYRLIGLKRIASTLDTDSTDAAAFLSATVAFYGDGDAVQEAEVFQKAANYFREHPELSVHAANWTTFPSSEDEPERYALELSVMPPAWLDPHTARAIYPNA
ncbi:hypothetical protein [Nocardia miyunensis]|uniref:hypothetical protein n=1 Tax=Nocardia miyunensis TaxID=282684 RepID=UPI0008347D9A|nr:hypothetical protein [Nocardia miyunensis]